MTEVLSNVVDGGAESGGDLGQEFAVLEFCGFGDFDQHLGSVEGSPILRGGLGELEEHDQRGLPRVVALRAAVTQANGRERRFDWVRGSQVSPVFGGEVVEGQEFVAVLLQTNGRLGIFRRVVLQEVVEGFDRCGACRSHPNHVQLGFRLQRLWNFVHDVAGLVNPAALLARAGPFFSQRGPEAQGSIADGHLGSDCHAATFQIAKHLNTPKT